MLSITLGVSRAVRARTREVGSGNSLSVLIFNGQSWLDKAHALVRPAGNNKTLARCLNALGSARLFAGDLPEARSLHDRAIAVYRELGELI